jgi:dynein heavy chain, axonemal
MHEAGAEGRRTCESVGIISPDGEVLPLLAPVITDGRPEEWLNDVEAAMFSTTKHHLLRAVEDCKGA